ncbi:hypothetical protein AYI69_g9302 [Smittium culicis]|uniref:Uncharacterized protein n=1 Tax=Smittium culicis TaxID=133412 RepID=A0A1R1XDJ2_9FUNG|nr:hypothetical protein AYI69_g9302 [Smittium culicis]
MKFNFVYLLSATLLSVAIKNTSVLSQSQEDTDLILDIPGEDFNGVDIENGTAAEPESLPPVVDTAPDSNDDNLTGDVPDSSNAPPVIAPVPVDASIETDDLPEFTDSLIQDDEPQTFTEEIFDFTDEFVGGPESDSEFTATAQPVDDGTITVTMYVTLPPVTGTVVVDQYGNPITTIIPGEEGDEEIENTEAPTETGPNPGAVSDSGDDFIFNSSTSFADDIDSGDLTLDIPDSIDMQSELPVQTTLAPLYSSSSAIPTAIDYSSTATLSTIQINDGDDLNEVAPEIEDVRAALSAPAINDANDVDVDDIKQKLENNGDSTDGINLF